jgi:hypothetical protein
MSYILDYGLEAPSRKWSMLVLLINDRTNHKEIDILHLQKIIRYYEYLLDIEELDYSDFKLGAVSYELEENLQTLVECGLVERKDGKYVLTDEGDQIAKELQKTFDPKEFQKLVFAKQQLNDLSPEETMYFMYKLIPSTQRNSIEFQRLDKKRDVLICSLFLKGRINATTAAKWLEISEKEFLDSLSSHS